MTFLSLLSRTSETEGSHPEASCRDRWLPDCETWPTTYEMCGCGRFWMAIRSNGMREWVRPCGPWATGTTDEVTAS